MRQEASDTGAAGAVSQEASMLAGGDFAENPAEVSKAPVQSALESDADSSCDGSEDSAGPGFTAVAVDNRRRKIAMTSSKKRQRPLGNRRLMAGDRVLRAQLLPVRRPKLKEPLPCARRQSLLLVRQTAVASRPRWGAGIQQAEDAPLLIRYYGSSALLNRL